VFQGELPGWFSVAGELYVKKLCCR
jgi:hypothetical protein